MSKLCHLFANSYKGFQISKENMLPPAQRKLFVEQYIQKYDFDIIVLLEMFDRSSIEHHFEYCYHDTSAGYYIASSFDICHIQNIERRGVRPILYFEIQNIPYLLTHIPPSQYCNRSLEEKYFLSHLYQQGDRSICLADFNVAPNHPFIQKHILSKGWKNAIFPTEVDYILYKNHHEIEVNIHDFPSISDHPFFHFHLTDS